MEISSVLFAAGRGSRLRPLNSDDRAGQQSGVETTRYKGNISLDKAMTVQSEFVKRAYETSVAEYPFHILPS